MTIARENDSVRTTAAVESLFDDRIIPPGAEGLVLEAKPDGTCLVELTLARQTLDTNGDFAQAVLIAGQYEVIQP